MPTNGPDYLIQLGLDTTRLEKEYPKVFKKLGIAQKNLNTMLKAELGIHKSIISSRQSAVSLTERQIRLQQKLNSLQGVTRRVSNPQAPPRPARPTASSRDPNRVSDRSKAAFGARVDYESRRSPMNSDSPAYRSSMAKAKQDLRQLKKELKSTTSIEGMTRLRERFKDINNNIREVTRSQQKLNRSLQKGSEVGAKFSSTLKSAALSYASAYAVIGVGKEVFRVGKEFDAMQAGLLAASDSAAAAKDNFGFLINTARRLGTDVESGVRGFNRLGVSMRGAGFAAGDIKEVFTAVQEASATFQLSADKSNLVMLAISQMASKSKISSEELDYRLLSQ